MRTEMMEITTSSSTMVKALPLPASLEMVPHLSAVARSSQKL
jgi:hypothetical protein